MLVSCMATPRSQARPARADRASHQQGHQRADRAGDARAIGDEVGKGLVGASRRHPRRAPRSGHRRRSAAVVDPHHGGQRPVHRILIRLPAKIPSSRACRRAMAVAEFRRQVHRIIGHPAEGVEDRRGLPHGGGQQQRGREERARARLQQAAAGATSAGSGRDRAAMGNHLVEDAGRGEHARQAGARMGTRPDEIDWRCPRSGCAAGTRRSAAAPARG